ncbi:glutamate--tRNA ligase [Rubripirellula amarantea]|uniref:Glutamate--tRNA ligase n=1 Tax=Rubripirellula amarantea TaxID=2527999 RepID=A0A5C5WRX9_9BACT|nr:glutamate--tRNA ligase [Rubripirellula amarantea]MDA8745083.1 glutamate--tRNA ligase [Rubripirellula amarantea]TWT52929.1 Glutamate--tRNA ligase [Rubripirellula amarantea]
MIRTRFAPSPTGYLHIGGVRTALFNWLLARQSGGQFLLRIDDTDAQRNVQEALQPILDGFRWLGMDWDEGPEVGGPHEPYFQSQRAEGHKAAAAKLLASGHAYRDYATADDLKELREAAEKQGERFFYDRRFMAEDDEAAAKYESEGRVATIRLKMPREGQCVINDIIRGEVRVDWATEQDHVIQRADGSCIYHLASVIDDHDLEITHVVRAEEHLPNTARQVFILDALGYQRPQFAHLPYVAEPGGTAKLSKRKLAQYEKNKDFADLLRHGRRIAERCGIEAAADTFNPVIIDFYREIGFDAEAILNYLVLLGWSLDGETEKFTVEEMIKHFSLERVNKSPASFDPRKLLAFQGDTFAALPAETRLERVLPFAEKAGFLTTDGAREKIAAIVEGAGDRMKMAGDILDFEYFFSDEITFDEKAFQKRINKPENARDLLKALADSLQTHSGDFSVQEAQQAVDDFCVAQKIELKDIIHALRVAVTGTPAGFGMFETLAILGKEKVVVRIRTALAHAVSS